MRWLAIVMVMACTHEPQIEAEPPPEWLPSRVPRLPPSPEPTPVTRHFAIRPVGAAARTSEGELRTLAIARRDDAIATFTREIAGDDRVRQLYAYWALRTLAPSIAAKHRWTLAADPTEIDFSAGCLTQTTTMGWVVSTIESDPMPKP